MIAKNFVKDIYKKNVVVISQNLTLKEALKTMVEKNVNALVVVDDHNNLVGVLSSQDIAAMTIPHEMLHTVSLAKSSKLGPLENVCGEIGNKKVKDVMQKNCLTTNPDTNIMEVIADFLKHDVYIMPVLDKDGSISGVVTRTEIKRALAQSMKIETGVSMTRLRLQR